MSRNPTIRNSTAELFDTSTDNIGLHLKNIYADRELEEKATTEESSVVQQEDSVIRNFRITAADGKKTAEPNDSK